MPKIYKSYWLYAVLIPVIVIVVDQWSKFAVLNYFQVPQNICEMNTEPGYFFDLSKFVDLALVCNQGISFGFLSGDSAAKRWMLTVFAMLMCVLILVLLMQAKDKVSRLGFALVLGGAIGNAIDRFRFGAVTDFISVHDFIPFFPWVFNIADSAITMGVIFLLYANFFGSGDKAITAEVKN